MTPPPWFYRSDTENWMTRKATFERSDRLTRFHKNAAEDENAGKTAQNRNNLVIAPMIRPATIRFYKD